MIDPDAARELIDMLEWPLYEKTNRKSRSGRDDVLLDLLGKLKLTYLR